MVSIDFPRKANDFLTNLIDFLVMSIIVLQNFDDFPGRSIDFPGNCLISLWKYWYPCRFLQKTDVFCRIPYENQLISLGLFFVRNHCFLDESFDFVKRSFDLLRKFLMFLRNRIIFLGNLVTFVKCSSENRCYCWLLQNGHSLPRLWLRN